MTKDIEQRLRRLREPFAPNQINKLPKPLNKNATPGRCQECGGWHGLPAIHIDYVGHAALTHRLLEVDPAWTWEPLACDQYGLPLLDKNGLLWIRLTVCGITRLGVGDASGKVGGNAAKELIGDALRNAAMRFGCALDLWHKGESLYQEDDAQEGAQEGAPIIMLSDLDLDDVVLAMRESTSLADLQAVFKDAWLRTTEDQHAGLKDHYDKFKAELSPVDGAAGAAPAPSAPITPRRRAAPRTPPAAH